MVTYQFTDTARNEILNYKETAKSGFVGKEVSLGRNTDTCEY